MPVRWRSRASICAMYALAVPAEVAQLVELGVVAGADRAAVGDIERRLVGDGFEDQVGDVGQLVQAVVDFSERRARRLPASEAGV